jgi:phage-related protein
VRRKIIAYGGYFESFKKTLTKKEQDKVDYCLLLLRTKDRVPKKFISLIRDGLYELRIEYNSNIFRVFFIFDNDNIVVLFNGFQKKTQKTPESEIKQALKIKNEYYADKQSQNR